MERNDLFWNFIFNYLVAFGGVLVFLLNLI